MAAGVTIDIPGIGNVEAKNAATEATLREILKAIQKGGLSSSGAGGRAGGAAGAAAGGAGVGAGAGASKGAAAATKSLTGAASKAGMLGNAMGKLAGGPVMMMAGALVELGNKVTSVISGLANMGDSVEAAADQFSFIPVVGGMFKAVASATQKATDSYLSSAKSGATFGGSINNFARAASGAGMTLEKFGAFVQKNGFAMTAFGATTESGAKKFAQVAKQLQSNASGLQALGFSTEDINQGLASYGELLKLQGRNTNKSNAELTAGANKYLKEMDALAKITGEERSAKEAEAKQLAQDAQFQAATANMDEKAAASFRNTVLSLPKPLQGFVKDFLATGTLTSEETQRIGAVMGQGVMSELQSMRNIMKQGGELSAAQQDRFRQILAAAGKDVQKNFGDTFAATREFDGVMQAATSAASLNVNANKDAAKAQTDAQKNTDGMNARMQEAQKTIARVSNEFTMFLANSGLLDTMMSAFKALVGIVQTVVMPIFTAFAFVIKNVDKLLWLVSWPLQVLVQGLKAWWNEITILSDALGISFQPVIDAFKVGWGYISQFLDLVEYGYRIVFRGLIDAGLKVYDTLYDYLYPAFAFIGRIGSSLGEFFRDNLLPAVKSVSDWFSKDFIPPIKAMLDNIWTAIKPVVDPIVKVFNSVKEAVGNFFRSFNTIGEVVDSLKLNFRQLALNLKEMWYAIKDFIPGLSDATPEERKALEEEKAALAEDRLKQDKKLEANAAQNLKEQEAAEKKREAERKERDRKIAAGREASDKKLFDHKKDLDKKGAGYRKEAETAAAKDRASLDYGGSAENLLLGFAAREGSPLTPKSENLADAGRKSIEAEAEQRKRDAERQKQEEAQKRQEETDNKKANEGRRQAPAQESSESLLAQLNTNMSRLIAITNQQLTVNEQQLSVQKSLTGDLFASV